MNVEPIVLTGPTLRLEPARLDQAPALWPKLGHEVFRHTLEWPHDGSLDAFAEWLRKSLATPDTLLFAVVPLAPGEGDGPVGVTGYLDIRPAHFGLEIGRTILAPAVQGTRVNPESKYLLLRHAFEDLGVVRVQFKTDLHNLHSQRAIEKLGAVREGVLRRFQARSSGFVRDTVVYSITDEEWPAVKGGLEARLGLGEA
jgi:ribosomal-protein-alanine N-acetyltransferase